MDQGTCLATKAIMEEGAEVGYMFREASDFEDDTGWRFFTGDESLDFIDQDDNIGMYKIADVVKQDSSIEKYLNSSIGTELERTTGSKEFVIVTAE